MTKFDCFKYSIGSGTLAFISIQDVEFILQVIGSGASALIGVVGVIKVARDYWKARNGNQG